MHPQSFIGVLVYTLGVLFLFNAIIMIYEVSQMEEAASFMYLFGYDDSITGAIIVGILILGFGKIIECVEKISS